MKGIYFTIFLEMAEREYGHETVDDLLENTELKSKGIYTAIGSYDSEEFHLLVSRLCEKLGISRSELINLYSAFLFSAFELMYASFFARFQNGFDFFESVEYFVHVELLKLYPDEELPIIKTYKECPGQMKLIYESKNKLADLLEVLIAKVFYHYGGKALVSREDMDEEGTKVKFIIIVVGDGKNEQNS